MRTKRSESLLARHPIALRLLLVAALAAAAVGLQALLAGESTASTNYVVNSVDDDADANPGFDGCDTGTDIVVASETVPECTLRAAIMEANVSGLKDVITFDPVVFPPGSPATIAPAGLLPQIEVELTIDASGAGVVLDGGGSLEVGLIVAYENAGLDFSLIGGGNSFEIQGFTADFPGVGNAGILVCGGDFMGSVDFEVCFDTTLDQISVDGVAISGSDYGIGVFGPNVNNLTVTNNQISVPADGVAGVGVGIFSDVVVGGTLDSILSSLNSGSLGSVVPAPDLGKPMGIMPIGSVAGGVLSDNSITIGGPENGNSISGGISAVMVGFAGALSSAVNVTVSNNAVLAGETGPGVGLAFCGEATESKINFSVDDNGAVTGDPTPTNGGWPGVYAAIDTDCDSAATDVTTSVTVNGNDEVSGGGDGVWADVNVCCGDKNASTIQVNGNGEIDGEDGRGVALSSDVGDSGYNSSTVEVMDNGSITGEGDGAGVDVDSNASGSNTYNTSTVSVTGNGTLAGSYHCVDIASTAGGGDNNTSTVHVDDNDVMIGASSSAVRISASALGGNGNESTVTLNQNGVIGGGEPAGAPADGEAASSPYREAGVGIASFAGGDSDDNVSTVEVIGNDEIVGSSWGLYINGFAGEGSVVSVGGSPAGDPGVAGAPGASGNQSTVTVSENGEITGETQDGVYVESGAGDDTLAGPSDDADENESTVTVSNNGDITGVLDGIEVISEAGNNRGNGDGNTSTVDIVGNQHVTGVKGEGITVASRAGTGQSLGGLSGIAGGAPVHGNGNTSTVTVTGTGAHDVTGGDSGIVVLSEAGAQECCNGGGGTVTGGEAAGPLPDQLVAGASNNNSDVTVTGNRDIFGDIGDGVAVMSRAGALFGEGDNNHVSVTVTDNRDITSGDTGNDGVDVAVVAGGATETSAENSTAVTVTGNDDIVGGDGHGVNVYSTVYGDPANTNSINVSGNTGDITGGGGDGFDIDLCCSANTVDIVDNGGNISGSSSGIDLYSASDPYLAGLAGPAGAINPNSVTIATISGNSISNSGGAGIEIAGGAFIGEGVDPPRSQITDNAIANNGGPGIEIYQAWGLLIGPNNVIEDNGSGATGIHIRGSESDGNTITQNSIFDNHGLGIDLDDAFGGPNVVGCALPELPPGFQGSIAGGDTPNECIPFPDFGFFVDGKLSGEACPDCLIEVFLADNTPADQDGHGEGAEYLGSGMADGDGVFSIDLPCGLGNVLLTSTATDKAGNTSEFGPNSKIPGTDACDPTPTLTLVPTVTATTPPTATVPATGTPGATPTPTITPTPTVTATGTLPTATATVEAPTATATSEGPAATATATSEAPAATATATTIAPTETEPPETPAFTPGDVNKDGVVNSVDAAIILQYTAGLVNNLAHPLNADADQNGLVNAIDAALILQFEAGLIDCLPPGACPAGSAGALVAELKDAVALLW